MYGCSVLSGLLVIGKLVSVLSFSRFGGVCVEVIVSGERGIIFQ